MLCAIGARQAHASDVAENEEALDDYRFLTDIMATRERALDGILNTCNGMDIHPSCPFVSFIGTLEASTVSYSRARDIRAVLDGVDHISLVSEGSEAEGASFLIVGFIA